MARVKKPRIKILPLFHKPLKNERSKAQGKSTTDKYPVALRVTYDGQRKYSVLKYLAKTDNYEIGESIATTKQNWDSDQDRFKKEKLANKQLERYEEKANEIASKIKDFTFTRFFAEFGTRQPRNVLDCFQTIIDEKKSQEKIKTAQGYNDTKSRIEEYYPNELKVEDIDVSFLKGLENYLKNKGNNVNTIAIYMRNIRAVFNWAIQKKYVDPDLYPFGKKGGYIIRTQKTGNKTLTKDEIYQIFSFPAKKYSRLWFSIRYFEFSYFCRGMNFKDIALLTESNESRGILEYIRSKTGNRDTSANIEPIRIKLKPEAASFLADCLAERFDEHRPYIFPVLETGLKPETITHRIYGKLKKINKDIRFVAGELSIPDAKEVTFYWARHTYSNVLRRAGFSNEMISEGLNHSDVSVTKAYLASFGDEALEEMDDKL